MVMRLHKYVFPVFLASLLCLATLAPPSAHAQRGNMVIDGPGFKIEHKKGWFGHSEDVYKDALGNTHVQKTGWFGHKTQETSVLGNQLIRNGDNVSIINSNGNPVLTKKKSWLGGESTYVNGNEIFKNLGDLFH